MWSYTWCFINLIEKMKLGRGAHNSEKKIMHKPGIYMLMNFDAFFEVAYTAGVSQSACQAIQMPPVEKRIGIPCSTLTKL